MKCINHDLDQKQLPRDYAVLAWSRSVVNSRKCCLIETWVENSKLHVALCLSPVLMNIEWPTNKSVITCSLLSVCIIRTVFCMLRDMLWRRCGTQAVERWGELWHIFPNPCAPPPFPQIDIIGAMVIVWRVRGKIIRSVLCNIVCNNCAQYNADTYEQT